ncbi:23S rRNA (guanine(745)-N(1))-methyltransferase [Vibrio rumoiensis]|uniref:23S rRNA (Guanine(745)-N(1))-methyltransferase n=1 Tax=Vibrio rumoiensis 1S-45 TaxID=1188252 RepID=A0A1E5E522_9VIBR|nr:23S rRNA (guanine(745)-N(1))-methyltransferase [Vibrio rumoiensis]OEF27681.1 23S rRNA (guanine(745)-N(1))-methyltransferase [Vibrio rumoiensis 1S-45]
MYQCPLCQHPLEMANQSFCCSNNHQFDKAKEGYVNLMPVQHKRSKQPGDNAEMMQARRRFLESKQYHPMRQAVADLCAKYLKGSHHQLLDIGCGEGYYTHFIAEQLQTQNAQSRCYGLDISKVAIRYAAKRYRSDKMQFCVASSHRLPFSDHSLDAVLRIYAPCDHEELQRVTTQQGIIVTVTPAARHLYQLRELVYPDVLLHGETPECITGFDLIEETKLQYPMSMTGVEADDLLQMTPFAWKASEQMRGQLKTAPHFECEAEFMLRVYKKITSNA